MSYFKKNGAVIAKELRATASKNTVLTSCSYQPYPNYKDSGVEWLGRVPEDWRVLPLKRLIATITEKTTSYNNPIGLENVESWTGQLVPTGTIFESEGVAFRTGDILFGKLRPYLAKVYVAKSPGEAIGDFHVLRPHSNEVDSGYIAASLRTKNFINIADSSTYGAKMPRVSWDFMGNIPVAFPPTHEQQTIVTFLDRETARIDALIAKQLRLIELLQEKRRALISHVVTKGLTPDVHMKDSGIEWLGEIPQEWGVASINQGYEVVLGKMLQPQQKSLNEQQVPYLKALHVNWEQFTDLDLPTMWATSDEIAALSVLPGDLLVCEGGEAGRAAIVNEALPENCIIQKALHRVRAKENDNGFVPYLLRVLQTISYSGWFDIICSKATIAHFTREKFIALACPYPPICQQKAIALFLDRETAKIDALISKAQQAITLAQERRAAIISAAVTGKICITQSVAKAKPLSKSREYFQRVVLGAWIIDQLHKESTFGRVKLQKALHLTEYHAQLPFQHSDYQRYPLGPHDPKALYSLEAQIKKQKWFDSKSRKGGFGKEYVPLENHEAYKQYFDRYFADKLERLQQVIDLLKNKDTQYCEVVSTLYGVWNDFLLSGQTPNDDEIIYEARNNWDPQKKEIPEKLWPKALAWMAENGLVPTGWGEPTTHRLES